MSKKQEALNILEIVADRAVIADRSDLAKLIRLALLLIREVEEAPLLGGQRDNGSCVNLVNADGVFAPDPMHNHVWAEARSRAGRGLGLHITGDRVLAMYFKLLADD